MESKQFCIFCGQKPREKTKEHVLPRWLLELTGDPGRVVTLGINYSTQKELRYSWAKFTFPACDACNAKYSVLEGKAKPIVERLLRREQCSAGDFYVLLDWLDKVRVGLWLGYYILQGNPVGIVPSFFINSRVGTKDRMLALYTIDTNELGLNAFGVNTFVFQTQPSCFALKINSIVLLNVSSDCVFSIRAGFPGPRTMNYHLDGPSRSMLEMSDWKFTGKIKLPNFQIRIVKPTIKVFQIVLPLDNSGQMVSLREVKDQLPILSRMSHGSNRSYLLKESPDRLTEFYEENELVEFDEVKGTDCRPLFEIFSSVFDIQSELLKRNEWVASDPNLAREKEKQVNEIIRTNRNMRNIFRQQVSKSR